MSERAAKLARPLAAPSATPSGPVLPHRSARGAGDPYRAVRAELAMIEFGQLARERIALARQELEAMVAEALNSSEAILSAAEAIAESRESSPADHSDTFAARIGEVFVACAFQDLMAQRVRRLHGLLDQLDSGLTRAGDMLAAEPGGANAKLEAGPALPGLGNDQDAVDILLRD